MPKTNHNKGGKQSTASAAVEKPPSGDNKPGLDPAIPFVQRKVDEDDNNVASEKTVEILVIIDESKSVTAHTNIDKKQFPAIKLLTGAGLEVLNTRRALTLDIFNLKGLTKADLVKDRLQYFERLLKKEAKLQ